MKTKKIKLLIVLGAFIVIMTGCLWLMSTPCPKQYAATVGTSSTPSFITTVAPAPESKVSFGCYISRKTAIYVKIVPDDLLRDLEKRFPGDEDFPPFEDRVFLYTDGEKIKVWSTDWGAAFLDDPDLYTGYIFGSDLLLFPGNHTAKIIIETRSGKIFEYEWHFEITIW